jgi:hypothetical protein
MSQIISASVCRRTSGVNCVMSVSRIIGPIFYDDTVNVVRYANNILRPFFAEMTEEERLCFFSTNLQQLIRHM